jgi:lipopolysaccharide/colanic/teichoic acid biosynthesis glycosyltransferase
MEILPAKLNLDKVKDLPVVRSNSSFDGAYNRYFKRILDVLFTSVGVVIISPFLLFIAIGVKLSSPGPIIFKQKRLGENGKFFDFYKFRSMVVGSDNDESRKKEMIDLIKGNNNNSNGGSTKVVNPSRITKFGKFIRKYSFDELPQLFNVIKGDMSLVGPRPCLPYEYEVYDDWHKRRLSVKPGCTGLWQVTSRSETSYDDMVILDIYYLQNISPWFDLQLLLKTIPVLLTGKGGE